MPADTSTPQRISNSSSLTDILIQVEDFLDSLDLYVFKNWFEGEVVDGPIVKRYWINITLQYDYEQMPDPRGGMRLVSRGCKVYFWKAKKEEARDIATPDDYREDGRHSKPKMDEKDIWLVEIQIPRRFINDLDATDLNVAEDVGVEQELINSAHEEDIDSKSAFEAPAAEEGTPDDGEQE